jgi:DNA polymerase I-like protein with 3'-5' exonuclease and polymerase domains
MTRWNIDVPTTEYYGRLPGHTEWAPGMADAFQALVNEVTAQPLVSFDTETTGLRVAEIDSEPASIPLYFSLAWGNRRCTVHAPLLQYFKPAMQDPNKWWVMANAKYDTHIAYNVGCTIGGKLVDTQVMHALLYEEKPHNLKYMCQHIGGWTWGDFQDQFGRITKANPPGAIIERAEREDFPRLVEYAANDAWGTLLVYNELRAQLERAGTHSLFRTSPPYIETLWDLFYKVEVPYTKALWQMERHGIRVNKDRLEQARPEAEKKISNLEGEIWAMRGYKFNVNSTPELRKWLVDEQKLEPLNLTKGGKTGVRTPSVDAKFLQHYADNGVPACKRILEYRNYSKLLGTYIKGLRELLDNNGRVHTRFNQDVARCMPAGELVLTNRGYIPVEKVKVGDLVISHTGKARRVTETSEHKPQPIYEVSLSNGMVLRTTGNHQYLSERGWVRSDCLSPNLHYINTHTLRTEEWADIPDWPKYCVSSWGRVRNKQTGWPLAPQPKGKWGHLKVTLSRNGAQQRGKDKKDFWIHQLVATCFVPKPLIPRAEVRHRDGIPWNNVAENLEWGTSSDNTEDARRHETLNGAPALTLTQVEEIRSANKLGQPASVNSKLSYEVAEQMRERYVTGEGRAELAREFGVSYHAVDSIVKDRTWTKPKEGVSAEELGEKYGVSAAYIRYIWAGRRWHRDDFDHEMSRYSTNVARVETVDVTPPETTYGLTVEVDHSHVTGGIFTHNTGRLSSSDPNLQNIPRPENDHWKLREAFIPADGYDIICFDYAQLEMRLLAAAAIERPMIDMIHSGKDIHVGNAEIVFGLPYDHIKTAKNKPKGELTSYDEQCLAARYAVKSIGFGILYGMGAAKMAHDLGISESEAESKIAQFLNAYPAVRRFTEEAVEETERTGYAFTVLGRRRNIPEIASHSRKERSRGERLSVNTQIQGSAADVVKMAQILYSQLGFERDFGCRMVLQVHDELVFECPKQNTSLMCAEIKELMEHPFSEDLQVHLLAEGGAGSSWGAVK